MKAIPELHVGELSIVDRGANKKKPFPIFKQEKIMSTKENWDVILKAVLETELEGEEAIEELITKMEIGEKGAAASKAVLRVLSGFKDEMPPEFLAAIGKMAGIPVEKAEVVKKEEVIKKEEEEVVVEKSLEGVPEEIKKHFEEIQKAADLKITALSEKNEIIEKQLKVETDTRLLAEWTEKARADLSHYPGKSIEEMGVILKSLAELDPKMAKTQFDLMKVASDALKGSEILKSAGGIRTHELEGSSYEKIEKLADGLVEKSEDLNMTKASAIAKVLESPLGAELYNKYLDEQKAANR